MPEPRLYQDLAHLWPALSPVEDYAAEADALAGVLGVTLPGLARPTVLQLGAGAGHVAHHLGGRVALEAVDRCEPMLAHCRRLNPGVPTHLGDMRTLRLGRLFDAVLIDDAVDYMASADDLAAALATAAAHTRAGGILVVCPTDTAETFADHDAAVSQGTAPSGDVVTCLSYIHDADPADQRYELVLAVVVREPGGGVRVEADRHVCGLFDVPHWRDAIARAGFDRIDADNLPALAESPGIMLLGRRRA